MITFKQYLKEGIIRESSNIIKTLNHPFNSQYKGLMFKDVNPRELKSLRNILDNEQIGYDVIKDLNYYQVITNIEPKNINSFNELVNEFEVATGSKVYDNYINNIKE